MVRNADKGKIFFFSEDIGYLSIILKMWSISMHRALDSIPALHKLAVGLKTKTKNRAGRGGACL